MPELNNGDINVISFYLPQFHTIPENDEAHGKGFTEWTNTRKAVPLFEGHEQPKTPLNEEYYCLLDEGIMEKQAEQAKEYGVFGFCYYHYWFEGGKKLLEKPLENMLKNPNVDIPFCLCWANENWSKRWDGGNNEVIVAQNYGDMDDLLHHVDYLCDFFKDSRYITVDGEPLFIIYKPELIPNLKKMIKTIRSRVRENGLKGIKIAVQYPLYYMNGSGIDLFDYYIEFEPKFIQDYEGFVRKSGVKKLVKKILLDLNFKKAVAVIEKRQAEKYIKNHPGVKELTHRDYDKDWKMILEHPITDKKMMAGAFVNWDNTPRNRNGLVYDNASPEKFESYMTQYVKKVRKEYNSKALFVNAWNEWAEGAMLEPDEKYGYAYLEGLRKALSEDVSS